jgi:flagellar basal-body rod protein FlgB
LRAAATPPQPPQSLPLRRTHPEHLPLIQPASIGNVQGTLVATPSDDVGRDLNTVSIDREMAKLTTNTLHYNASAEILARAFDQLKRTVSETQ